jgi:hypothetical protein
VNALIGWASGSILILLLYTEAVMREDFIVQEKASELPVRMVTC